MIPRLLEMNTENSNIFLLNKNTIIQSENEDYINLFYFYSDKILKLKDDIKNKIIIHEKTPNFDEESYKIENLGAELHIYGKKTGIIWAISTIIQLAKENENSLSFNKIFDSPKFSYRGQMVDIVRHFYSVKTLKSVIDVMFFTKLNKLHLHLSDDQGFRLDIESLPKLKEISLKRRETRKDKININGFLNKTDIKNLIDYATLRGIEIIPEIDVPAHCTALISAYPELSCENKKIPVATTYGIMPNIICAGNEKVFDFLEILFTEVAKMFKSDYIHIGGDEALKTKWVKCQKCKSLLKSNGFKSYEDLQGYFLNRVSDIILSLNKTPIVWNEALRSGFLNNECVCQFWTNNSYGRTFENAKVQDRKVIVSKVSNCYLDYPHKLINLEKSYNFDYSIDNSKNVIGVETPIWTEHIRNEKQFFKKMFPRAIAVAENGWVEKKDYKKFKSNLIGFYKILDKLDVDYTTLKKAEAKGFYGYKELCDFSKNFLSFGYLKTAINVSRDGMRIK